MECLFGSIMLSAWSSVPAHSPFSNCANCTSSNPQKGRVILRNSLWLSFQTSKQRLSLIFWYKSRLKIEKMEVCMRLPLFAFLQSFSCISSCISQFMCFVFAFLSDSFFICLPFDCGHQYAVLNLPMLIFMFSFPSLPLYFKMFSSSGS